MYLLIHTLIAIYRIYDVTEKENSDLPTKLRGNRGAGLYKAQNYKMMDG